MGHIVMEGYSFNFFFFFFFFYFLTTGGETDPGGFVFFFEHPLLKTSPVSLFMSLAPEDFSFWDHVSFLRHPILEGLGAL